MLNVTQAEERNNEENEEVIVPNLLTTSSNNTFNQTLEETNNTNPVQNFNNLYKILEKQTSKIQCSKVTVILGFIYENSSG